jgi:hypothetical protein
MSAPHEDVIASLVTSALGQTAGARALDTLNIDSALLAETGEAVSRVAFAMALNVVLFHELLDRVPSGAAYVADTVANGGRVTFDHGALRTIRFADGPTGGLPAGQDAFARILEPLGYAVAGTYPLPALRMTGRAYCHVDAPAAVPQFFLSELHVEQFAAAFAAAAVRVFGTSIDPLDDRTGATLADYAGGIAVSFEDAAHALPVIAAAFDRHHQPATTEDYEILLAQSGEAAWIATEGNAFNHATDRVPDVEALADRLKAGGSPMKDKIEVSTSGRVRQTAFRADSVERDFAGGIRRTVPGSFYEFITRAIDPETGVLDLRFDSGNATGIFAMTRAT